MLHQNTKWKHHNVWHRDSGIRRGRVLSPLLFLRIIDFIIKISVNSPVSGTKWKHDRLTDLDSADDIALLSDARNVSRTWRQSYMSRQQRGLRISCEKTKTMSIRTTSSGYHWTTGCRICRQLFMSWIGDVEFDTRARLGKAASVYQRLCPAWTGNTINTSTKSHLRTSVVISAAIYAADTWKGMSRRCLRVSEWAEV